MMRSVVVAFDVVILGLMPMMVNVVAQVANGGADATQWVQLGGVSAAMTALAYMAKKFADGTIVSFKVSEVVAASAQREEKLVGIIEDQNDREDAHRAFLLAKGLTK